MLFLGDYSGHECMFNSHCVFTIIIIQKPIVQIKLIVLFGICGNP